MRKLYFLLALVPLVACAPSQGTVTSKAYQAGFWNVYPEDDYGYTFGCGFDYLTLKYKCGYIYTRIGSHMQRDWVEPRYTIYITQNNDNNSCDTTKAAYEGVSVGDYFDCNHS